MFTEVEEILDFLQYKMSIEEVTNEPMMTAVKGVLAAPLERTIREIKEYFSQTEYTPLFDIEDEKHIVRFGIFKKVEDKPKYWLNIILFIATIGSTIFAGYLNSGSLSGGVVFSFSIMAILTCHELGHYFVSRNAGMITTLPYFIPIPFHFIGTFGAIIRMKSIVPSRSSLLRVGMAGPLAGFIVALPITIIGIALSKVTVVPQGGGFLQLGDSLLFYLLTKIIHPAMPPNATVLLHPMAFAGWLGLLVTSMNLIPVGQLDGGHIGYSLFLKKRRFMYIPIGAILVALGFLWFGWFIWGILAFFFARRDPIIQDAITPLNDREKRAALIPLFVLILSFVPQPFVYIP